jgi:DNA-binding transcriptional regulator LsrR (DeoR family)
MVVSSYDTQSSIGERRVALNKETQKLDALRVVADMPKHFSDGKLVGEKAGWSLLGSIVKEVLMCRDQGFSQSETARRLGIHQTTVRRVWLRAQ